VEFRKEKTRKSRLEKVKGETNECPYCFSHALERYPS